MKPVNALAIVVMLVALVGFQACRKGVCGDSIEQIPCAVILHTPSGPVRYDDITPINDGVGWIQFRDSSGVRHYYRGSFEVQGKLYK